MVTVADSKGGINRILEMHPGEEQELVIMHIHNLYSTSITSIYRKFLNYDLNSLPLAVRVRCHFDKIVLCFDHRLRNQLFSQFESNGFSSSPERIPSTGRYGKIKRFNIPGQEEIQVLYGKAKKSQYDSEPRLNLLNLYEPSADLLANIEKWLEPSADHKELFDNLLPPSVSSAELAFDLFCDKPSLLQQYLDWTVNLQYRRGSHFYTKGLRHTLYANGRSNQKTLKTYLEKVPKPRFVRLELTLRQPILKKSQILRPIDIYHIWIDTKKHIRFNQINIDKLFKYLNMNPRTKQQCCDNTAMKRVIISWLDCMVFANPSLMTSIDKLKIYKIPFSLDVL